MFEEEKLERGRRDGDFDGIDRLKIGIKGFKNE